MSAGGLSYSALNNYGRVTLPSVDTWGTNNNILKDPPKSAFTRRKTRVGDTNFLVEDIEGSGSRTCEAINHYARGVNPMVGVNFSNNGTTGGQGTGVANSGSTQAFLPHRVMRDGAFRPPVLTQAELLPLSRQPRLFTKASTKSSRVDHTKRIHTQHNVSQMKEVFDDRLKVSAKPTGTYKIERPLDKPMETKYKVQDIIKTSGSAGLRTMDIKQRTTATPYATVHDKEDMLHAFAGSKASTSRKFVNNSKAETKRYTQSKVKGDFATNASSNKKNTTSITDILDLAGREKTKAKNKLNIDMKSALSGNEKVSYIHDDIELNRVLPVYTSSTNKAQNIHKAIEVEKTHELSRNMPVTSGFANTSDRTKNLTNENISREYKLHPTLAPGGFAGKASKPSLATSRKLKTLTSKKHALNQKAKKIRG